LRFRNFLKRRKTSSAQLTPRLVQQPTELGYAPIANALAFGHQTLVGRGGWRHWSYYLFNSCLRNVDEGCSLI
jgi:hypothetical protein